MAVGTSVRLSCARCSTSHRVQDVYALKPGMHATCTGCKAIFVVVSMPTVSLDEAAPSHTVHETPRQDPRSVDQEATRAEGTQRLGSQSRNTVFHGVGGTLFGIHLVNTLLTLVTLAERATGPDVPGATGGSAGALAKAAGKLGYPVMVKAALGGGGKGIRPFSPNLQPNSPSSSASPGLGVPSL